MRRASAIALLFAFLTTLPAAAASDPLRPNQWALEVVGAPGGWRAGGGAGVTIAVVDSGVDLDHEDLADRVLPGRDYVDGGTPDDEHGHGTHVAGIAAAVTGNGRGVAGVAPAASILPVRVLDENGSGSAQDVARGIRWAVDRGARVVNLSLGDLGEPLFGPAFDEAIAYAWSRGAIPVVAAGNEYLLSSGYSDQNAIVVSATDRRDRKPGYSSGVGQARWGMAAPGGAGETTGREEDDVLSTYRGNAYAYLAGTSMAAPHVSGAAAVLLARGLSPRETVDRLLATAKDIGPEGRDATFGYGRLDVAAAAEGLRPPARGSGQAGREDDGGSRTPAEESPAPEGRASPEQEPRAAPSSPPQGAGPGGRPTGGEGTPVAPIAAGVLILVLASAVAWVMFRPGPEA